MFECADGTTASTPSEAQLAARKAASRGARRGEAEAYPRTPNRGAARDAGAIARPGAGRALAPESVGAFAAAG